MLELTNAPSQKLHLLVKIHEGTTLARQLIYDGDSKDGAIKNQEQTILDMAGTMKRRYISATIT